MTTQDNATLQSGPTEAPPPSRMVRVLTSWKLWAVLLVLGVLGIGISLTMPIVHRLRALQYFDRNSQIGGYELSGEHEDWPERYGEWVNGLREVDSLGAVFVTDETLSHVGVLHEARLLGLVENDRQPITDRGLASLRPFERLEEVHVMGRGFTDEALAELFATRPPLEEVFLIDTGAGRQTLKVLSEIPSIRELYILSRELDDEAYRDLAPLPELSDIYAMGLGDQGAEWLATCTAIENVVALNSGMSDVGLCRLSNSTDISSLDLYRTSVSDGGLECLAKLNRLRRLTLIECPLITASGISRLPDLPELQILSLSANLLTPESVARLQELPELRSLAIYGTISTPELRATTSAEWEFSEEPEITDELFWQLMHEIGSDW